MLKRFGSRYPSFLGIDVSPTSVKILAISCCNHKLCIEDYLYAPLTPLGIGSSKDKLISTIKTFLSRLHSPAKYAAIALPDDATVSKTIQMASHLTAIEMEKLVFIEANKVLPGDIYVDFSIVGPSENSRDMLDISFVAAKAEHIQKRIGLLKEARVTVQIVGVESHILSSVINRLSVKSKLKMFALIHIGFECLSISIFDNGKLIHRREEALAFDLSKVKRYIQNNLELVFPLKPQDLIQMIYLVGEVNFLKTLSKEIENQTGIITMILNPFLGLTIAPKIATPEFNNIAPLFMLPFGLALRLVNAE